MKIRSKTSKTNDEGDPDQGQGKIQALNAQTDQMEKDILDQGTAYVERMTKNFDQAKEGCIQEIMDRMFNKN